MKHVRYLLEYIMVRAVFLLFRLMPFDTASKTGGQLARFIGPKTGAHRTAWRNLRRIYPDKSDAELETIALGVWENLGRTVGEFPHLPHLKGAAFAKRVKVKGKEKIDALQTKKFFFFSAHIGNWELAAHTGAVMGYPMMLIYRPANNPYVEKLIQTSRRETLSAMFPKGKEAARAMIKSLRDGETIGMLMDQKMNEGMPIPFLGHDAMTATAIAECAVKFDVPLVPVHLVRREGAYFEVIVGDVMYPAQKDVKTLLTEINAIIGGWVEAHPEQWFWVHNRWPKG